MGGVIRNKHGEWKIRYMGNIYKENSITIELLIIIQELHIALTKKLIRLEAKLLGLFKNIVKPVLDPSKKYYIWRIRQAPIDMSEESEQHSLEVTTDCKKLIDIISLDHPSYTSMVFDCSELLRKLGSPLIQYSNRETN